MNHSSLDSINICYLYELFNCIYDKVLVKQEPVDLDYAAQHSVIPSVGPASVWEGDFTSVQMASVDPATPLEVIGDPEGTKTLQFFYQSPLEDIKIGFPPVRVNTDEEVNCVVALVTEKAEDFNRSVMNYCLTFKF